MFLRHLVRLLVAAKRPMGGTLRQNQLEQKIAAESEWHDLDQKWIDRGRPVGHAVGSCRQIVAQQLIRIRSMARKHGQAPGE